MAIRVQFSVWMVAALATLATASQTGRCFAAGAPSSAQDLIDQHNLTDPHNKGTKISSDVADALVKAQKEDADKQLDAALADARKADAATQSNYEKLKVDQILTQIYMDKQDIPDAAKAAEAAADLQNIPAGELPDVLTNACILATAAYDYDKAANYARGMQSLRLSDDRSKRIIDTALQNEPKPASQAGAHP